jgi:hypothetical protein
MVVEVIVGERIVLEPTTPDQQIVLTMEAKHGQRGRLRVQSAQAVRVSRPEKATA